MLKGLRLEAETRHETRLGLTGFPDVEGIETSGFNLAPGGVSLTGFPDVEGIETDRNSRSRNTARLTGFPDVEGIET